MGTSFKLRQMIENKPFVVRRKLILFHGLFFHLMVTFWLFARLNQSVAISFRLISILWWWYSLIHTYGAYYALCFLNDSSVEDNFCYPPCKWPWRFEMREKKTLSAPVSSSKWSILLRSTSINQFNNKRTHIRVLPSNICLRVYD